MDKQINTVGRRKEAVARIYMNDGSGKITINGKDYKEYFPLESLQLQVSLPLDTVESENQYDIVINVKGGGIKGQAQAIKLGIARALDKDNFEEYHPLLKKAGLLTRDSRAVERKKYGKVKARKGFQFSKR